MQFFHKKDKTEFIIFGKKKKNNELGIDNSYITSPLLETNGSSRNWELIRGLFNERDNRD